MARLIEMMKQSAVPAGVMRSAARGALAIPPAEMLEILVFLTSHSMFGEQARMTLAGFDEAGSAAALEDPNTPQEVLDYFLLPGNRRPKLLLSLCNNPAVSEDLLVEVAENATPETISIMVSSERVTQSPTLLKKLKDNPNFSPEEGGQINERLAPGEIDVAEEFENITDAAVGEWLKEHQAELKAEQGEAKPFALMGGLDELGGDEPKPLTAEQLAAAKGKSKEEDERLSILQKLARMNVSDRIKLAMLGTREERSILIRDGSKLVSSAVLASPKVSEQEVETFANMKNVRENVLRDIGRSHKFKKNYVVLKNLCSNPRTPLDLSLALIKNLLVPDLKVLGINKNVPDTLRKTAIKLFQMRAGPGGGR
jgi:hypothetical protein